MEYFCLDHPPDRLTLCNRSNCEDIADYLEVNCPVVPCCCGLRGLNGDASIQEFRGRTAESVR